MDKEQLQTKLTEIFEQKFKENFKSEFENTSGFNKVNVCYLHDFFEAGCNARQEEIDQLQANIDRRIMALGLVYSVATELKIKELAKCIVSWPVNDEILKKYQGLVQEHLDRIATDEDRNLLLCEENQKLRAEINTFRSAIEDYYKALNNRQHGGLAAHHALLRIEAILGMSWDEYNKENMLGNYAILAKEASNVSNS